MVMCASCTTSIGIRALQSRLGCLLLIREGTHDMQVIWERVKSQDFLEKKSMVWNEGDCEYVRDEVIEN